MRLSDQYQSVGVNPPLSRQGIVNAFNSAYRPEGATGAHWNRYQYDPKSLEPSSKLDEISKFDRDQISSIFAQSTEKNKNQLVSILDFGCGNGRLTALYEKLAKQVQKSNIKLRVIAVDTSREALNQFAIRLQQAGFEITGKHSDKVRDLQGDDPGYLFDDFVKDNLEVKLIHSNIDNPVEKTEKLILDNNDNQKLMMTLSFDTLPFIESSEERVKHIKMFRDITDKDLLLTVPGLNVEKWQPLLKDFAQRREQAKLNNDESTLGLAKEPNSIMYNFRENYLFYKFFDRLQLAKEAAQAGLKNFKVRINQLWHPQRHREVKGLEDVDMQSTKAYNHLVTKEGHSNHLDSIFKSIDGFIQLHDKS